MPASERATGPSEKTGDSACVPPSWEKVHLKAGGDAEGIDRSEVPRVERAVRGVVRLVKAHDVRRAIGEGIVGAQVVRERVPPGHGSRVGMRGQPPSSDRSVRALDLNCAATAITGQSPGKS